MSEPTRAQLQQAYQLIKNGQRDEAIAILRPIVTVDPNNVDAWWLMANAAIEPAEQRSALDRVLLLRPDHKQAQEKLNALKGAEEFRFDQPGDSVGFGDVPEKAKRGQPMTVVQQPRQGTNPIVIILAVVGVLALVVCGVCFVIASQGATLFGSAIATLAESVTSLPGTFSSFEDNLGDVDNLTMRGSINRGDTVNGRLSSLFESDGYTFNGETGQSITITVDTSADDFLPQVALYDPGDQLVESDSAFSFDSSLDSSIIVRLPSSGQYTIVVSGFFGSEGSYTLMVQ